MTTLLKTSAEHCSEMDLTILSETGVVVEIIPERLYWTSRSSTPINVDSIHYFSTVSYFNDLRECWLKSGKFHFVQDQTIKYEAFYSDFGPLNLAQLYRYCKLLEA